MRRLVVALLAVLVMAGCTAVPQRDLFTVTPESLERRQIETRRYDGISETDLMAASANVLQDLGFNLENSETKLGVLTASKERDAYEGAEIAMAIAIALLGGGVMSVSQEQTIRVSLVVRPVIDSQGNPMSDAHFVRVTFQREVRRTDNSTHEETLKDQAIYQGFHEKLSKSVFIEAQKL